MHIGSTKTGTAICHKGKLFGNLNVFTNMGAYSMDRSFKTAVFCNGKKVQKR
jgi:hypothetical protein